eukprot:PhM_4_TR9540/c0_g1_i2/m.34245
MPITDSIKNFARVASSYIVNPFLVGTGPNIGLSPRDFEAITQVDVVRAELENLDTSVTSGKPWGLMQVAVAFSGMAYAEPSEMSPYFTTNWSPTLYRVAGPSVGKTSFRGNIDVVVFTSRDVMVVAWRGTELPFPFQSEESLGDWMTNFCMINKEGQLGTCVVGGQSHYAFQHGVNEHMKGELGAAIRAFSKQHGANGKIFVTGHSQGGGLAVLSHVSLLHEGIDGYVGCVTLAAPKVLDRSGMTNSVTALDDYNKTRRARLPSTRILHVINEADPIPHLPPAKNILPGGTWFPATGRRSACCGT